MDISDATREQLQREPGNLKLLGRYCRTAPDDKIGDVVALLSERIAGPPISEAFRLAELRLFLMMYEKYEALQPGRTDVATSLKETEIRYAQQAAEQFLNAAETYIARKPRDWTAATMRGDVLASLGRLPEAHAQFAAVSDLKLDGAASSVDLDPAFHATLDGMDPLAGLPALTVNNPGAVGPRAIFVAGDGVYFELFGRALVQSLSPYDVSLAIHLMDASPAQIGELPPHAYVSSEITGRTGQEAREYYHAIRFARFLQFMLQNPNTATWFIDMDSLLVGSPDALFDLLAPVDLALHFAPRRLEPRNKISAHMIGVSPAELARRYIHRVAAYIGHMHRAGRLVWGTDQVALYTVLTHFPTVTACGIPAENARVIQPAKPD